MSDAMMLEDIIDRLIDVRMNQLKFNKSSLGEVIAVNGSNLNIRMTGSSTTLTDIPNRTGNTVAVGDRVWCFSLNNSDSLMFALIGGTGSGGGSISLPIAISDVTNLQSSLDSKVDEVTGKQLSTEDYTTAEKTKLNGIESNANNYSLPIASPSVSGGVRVGNRLTISSGVLSANLQSDNNFTNILKTKLDGISENATQNNTDAFLLDRANHTGTQLASTISNFSGATRSVVLTGLSTSTNSDILNTDTVLVALGKLQAQINSNESSINSHTGNTNNPHSTNKSDIGLSDVLNYGIATQSEAEAGTSNVKYMTPLRVKDAIDEFATSENLNVISAKTVASLPNTYPMGISIFYAQESFANSMGMGSFTNVRVMVQTNRANTTFGTSQKATIYSTTSPYNVQGVYERASYNSGSTWSPWVRLDVYDYNNLTNRPTIPTATSDLTNDSGFITSSGSITGNAATATKLQTARTINGISFDGTSNIEISSTPLASGTSLPTATSSNRGSFFFLRNDTLGDKIYICIKADSTNYKWLDIGSFGIFA